MLSHLTALDLILILLFLGTLQFGLGAIFQGWIMIKQDKGIKWKHVMVIILTRILTFGLTLLLLYLWRITIDIDFMFGPFMLPAILPELVLSILLLKAFGYSIAFKRAK